MGWLLPLLRILCFQLLLLFHFPSFSSSLAPLCHPDQSSALLQFKSSFTIVPGASSDYCNPKTTSWQNGTDCCSWLGVTCDPMSGHVIGLDLSCSFLQGDIHPNSSLFRLTHLQRLSLDDNYFIKSQLSSQFGEFVSLVHLNLSDSGFEGEIPSEISHLSKLSSLDLSGNSLKTLASTDISENLTNHILCLPNLQELYLSRNYDLEGQLPESNCKASLNILDLSDCQFHGSIPSSFSNLTHLTFLSLSGNNLNGSIPSSLSTLPHLTHLDLSSNYLGGELPSSLSNLQHLVYLDLSFNKFSGEIPDVFGRLTKLETLGLGGNSLGGQLPSFLFDLTRLSILDCSFSKLEGSLPNKITGFPNLSVLYLNDNLLNGTIPSWCSSLPSLLALDLSNNQFTGHIGAISSYSLEFLHLCSNKLQGNIPESIRNLVNLTDLCFSSNNLSGPVNFQLFSKLQNLKYLDLSQNSLSLTIEINVNDSFSQLQSLSLSSCNLTEFPKLSGNFSNFNLIQLDLSNNKLHGKVPTWLQKMDSISFLNLSQNLLTSMDQFSKNSSFFYVDLSSNLLTEDIFSSICNVSALQILNLSHNKLSGIIPQCLINLTTLQVLDLQGNKLYGTLPITFPKTNWLEILNLNDNQLQGPLPKSLSDCTGLKVLNVGNNQIEDAFPHWLQTLPYLTIVVLQGNMFHGPITNWKSKHLFPRLIIFDISDNNFSGPLPTTYLKNFKAMMNVDESKSSLQYLDSNFSLSDWASKDISLTVTIKGINIMLMRIPTIFVTIDLSKNKFEGEIPSVTGELHALKGLNLSHNRLNGSIPRSMGSLTNLESLDLSSNMLTGEIPMELTNLNYLEVLNLSQNHLVGEIPQGKQFNTFLNDSYGGNLGLCGFPLPIKCNKDPEEHSPSSVTFHHEENFGFGWKPVALGYGCGMVFGVILGCCVLLTGKPKWLVRMVRGEPNKRVKGRMRTRMRMRTRIRENHGRMNELVRMA